jgi:undecaprenyl phosphate N,N'-diacetylbacillosamine 1-phosphate transferase
MYRKTIKRLLDVTFSALLLIIFAPVMVIISILIKIDSKGPVIFSQPRSGKGEKVFTMYKFRTMSQNNDVRDFNKENELTKVGCILRKTSLDELPQLFNIFMGNMSFVGPRPWITDYAVFFTKNQKRRLEVLPGITGLAQVSGRNDISVIEKINLDIKYVDSYNFKTDIEIITKTILEVLKKTGS